MVSLVEYTKIGFINNKHITTKLWKSTGQVAYLLQFKHSYDNSSSLHFRRPVVSANAMRVQMGLSVDGCLTLNALAHAQTVSREKCRPAGHVTVVVVVMTASPVIR